MQDRVPGAVGAPAPKPLPVPGPSSPLSAELGCPHALRDPIQPAGVAQQWLSGSRAEGPGGVRGHPQLSPRARAACPSARAVRSVPPEPRGHVGVLPPTPHRPRRFPGLFSDVFTDQGLLHPPIHAQSPQGGAPARRRGDPSLSPAQGGGGAGAGLPIRPGDAERTPFLRRGPDLSLGPGLRPSGREVVGQERRTSGTEAAEDGPPRAAGVTPTRTSGGQSSRCRG